MDGLAGLGSTGPFVSMLVGLHLEADVVEALADTSRHQHLHADATATLP